MSDEDYLDFLMDAEVSPQAHDHVQRLLDDAQVDLGPLPTTAESLADVEQRLRDAGF
jgi:hypothetical protein